MLLAVLYAAGLVSGCRAALRGRTANWLHEDTYFSQLFQYVFFFLALVFPGSARCEQVDDMRTLRKSVSKNNNNKARQFLVLFRFLFVTGSKVESVISNDVGERNFARSTSL